jgi:chaperonin GroES
MSILFLGSNIFLSSHIQNHTGGMHMKIRPLNDRILVKRLEGEEKTAGGIIIPDSAKEKPAEGEIVAVGPGKLNDAGERVAIDVAVGDRVLFSKYGGTEVKLDGEDFLIMREDDILGVVQA